MRAKFARRSPTPCARECHRATRSQGAILEPKESFDVEHKVAKLGVTSHKVDANLDVFSQSELSIPRPIE
jgi:hypothetical protein